MADFPGSIFSPRTLVNLPGISFDPTQTKNLFAEDVNSPNAEIVAIETTLGLNPQGSYDTVADRLDAIPSTLPTWWKETPTGDFDGSNAVFSLSETPILHSLALSLARQPQIEGVDFTLSGNIITFSAPPDASLSGEPFQAQYQAS